MPRKLDVELRLKDRLTKRIDAVEGRMRRFTRGVNRALTRTINIRNVAIAATLLAIGKSSVDAAIQIEVFQKQLLAVSRSAAEADQKLQAIREFARTSPLETKDVVQSYVQLRAVGIDPTIEQMKTLGGVSLLFGQQMQDTLQSFIGLNRRTLRRLGVEVDRTGSKAIIVSGNVRREVSKDSASIREALMEVWEERFPDAIGKASGTLSAKLAIMRSNIFEMQAQLIQEFLPDLKKIIDAVAGSFEEMVRNIRILKASIYSVILPFRIAFNGLQIAVDSVVAAVLQLGVTVRVVLSGFLNLLAALTEPIRVVGEALFGLARRAGMVFRALVDRDWKMLKEAAAGFWEDLKGIGSRAVGRWKSEWKAFVGEYKEGLLKAGAYTQVWKERTSKNMGDIASAMLDVKQAFEDVDATAKKADLGGTGTMGAGTEEEGGATKGRSRARQIANDKILAEKMYADLLIESIRNRWDRERALIDRHEAERLEQIRQWRNAEIITHERYEDMKTLIERQASMERRKLYREELWEKVGNFTRASGYLVSIMQSVTEATKTEAKKRQGIMYAAAIIDAASASVSAIRAVIQDDSISSVYAKIAMAVLAVGAIWAAAGAQMSQISSQSFAHGTMGARAGMALVGEGGPELVDMPAGSRVYTNYQTRNYSVSQGDININVAGNADRRTVQDLRQVATDMRHARRYHYMQPSLA